MAEKLLELGNHDTPKGTKHHEHTHHEHTHHEHRIMQETASHTHGASQHNPHELFLPKHHEPALIEDHHVEHQSSTPASILSTRATNAFYANNGDAYWTLGELGDALMHMSDEAFNHHVSPDHNDFAAWTQGCFNAEEQAFAQQLRGQDREGMLRAFMTVKGMPSIASELVHQSETVFIPVEEPARESEQQPQFIIEETQAPLSHEHQPVHEQAQEQHEQPQALHHDEKVPLHPDVRVPHREPRQELIKQALEGLATAHATAKNDLATAREKFITVRTMVFAVLTDDERLHVLPKLRETYDHLRHAR